MGLGLNINMGLGRQGGGGESPYSAETQAYFAAVPNNTYSDAEKLAIDTFIRGLKTDGIWTKLDQLYLLCAKSSTETESRVNLVYPSCAANATPSADPKRAMSKITAGGNQLVWTSGQGYVTTSGTEKLSGMYVPDGNSQFKLSDSHIMAYCPNNVAGATGNIVCGSGVSGVIYQMNPRNASNFSDFKWGTTTARQAASSNTDGIWIVSMATANQLRIYRNGSQYIGNNSAAQTSLPSIAPTLFYFHDASASYYPGRISAYSIGAGLSPEAGVELMQKYTTALQTLFTALGA